MIRGFTLPLALAALASGGVAVAQDEQRTARGAGISQGQAQAMADRAFARLDANGDGVIDASDRTARQRARFERLDADGDGVVTLAEFEAVREARTKPRSQTRAEGATSPQRREARARRGPGAGTLFGTGGLRGLIRGPLQSGAPITQDEFRAAALARFEAADADGDGIVTREERRAHAAEMRAQRRAEGRGFGRRGQAG